MERFEKFAAAGLDLGWLRTMEQKYGSVFFDLVESLLSQGFSAAWIITAVDKLHPVMMDVFAHIFTSPAKTASKMGLSVGEVMDGITEAIPTGTLDGPLVSFMLEKVISLLPVLGLSGWKLTVVTAALHMLVASLKSNPEPTPAPAK